MLSIYLSAFETQRERDLFTELYETYNKRMKYIANKIIGDPHLAENIVHDSFLVIADNLEKFFSLDCHKTKGLIDIIIRRKSVNERNRESTAILVEDFSRQVDEQAPELEDFVVTRIQYEKIVELIKGMDEKYRSVLILKYVYEYSPKEISEVTGVPEATVRQLYHRGKQKLRRLLSEEAGEDE